MAYRTPPFITPFAIVSIVLALGATNVVVNKATNTSEGAMVTKTSSSTTATSASDESKASSDTASSESKPSVDDASSASSDDTKASSAKTP